jgi:hypothetical protein
MRYKHGLVILGGCVLVGAVVVAAAGAAAAGVLPLPAPLQRSTGASGCVTAAATPTSAAVASAASVVLRTDASCYSATAPIIVTIENHTSTTIVFWDHQSGCSVVSIALRTHDHWQQVASCSELSPNYMSTLAAEHRLLVTIGPPEDDGQHGWASGTYKAFFSYEVLRVQATATTPAIVGPGGAIESAAFSVS